MASILILRLLVDFGLLVLIWMIQLIVYPSFLFYKKEHLFVWHKKYTLLISYIVAPLMLVQLAIAIFLIITNTNIYNTIALFIIAILWISTFLQFVPIHHRISRNNFNKEQLHTLVHRNWIRTIFWSLLFVVDFSCYLIL